MVSTFTPNLQIEQPARGDDVGTWDTPVNGNMTIIDLVGGGIATQSLNNSNIVLSAAQFRSKGITFNSTLTGSVTITFPTSFTKSYEFFNACTGSSAFTITLETTAAGGQVICCPPGQWFECVNDGTNIKFKNFGGPIGTYFDYCGSSSPAWNDGCTVPPYVVCDGTSFSSGTYPLLTMILGGTTKPDARGRVRATLNQTTTRMLSSNGGVDGTTLLAAGGVDSVTLATSQIPSHTHGVTDPSHSHSINGGTTEGSQSGVQGESNGNSNIATTNGATTGITIQSAGGGALHTNAQPTYIGGITLLRAG